MTWCIPWRYQPLVLSGKASDHDKSGKLGCLSEAISGLRWPARHSGIAHAKKTIGKLGRFSAITT